MSDVRVHANSEKPARLNALAYTQGNQIHLGPGQERHLPHEAWHVVQQKQGRVRATGQTLGVNINDDTRLEREADRVGRTALEGVNLSLSLKSFSPIVIKKEKVGLKPVQRMIGFDNGSIITGVPFFRGTTGSGTIRRPGFIGVVAAPIPAGQARCHMVPFENLAETLTNHLNEVYRSEAAVLPLPLGLAAPLWWAAAVAIPPALAQNRMIQTTDASYFSAAGVPIGGPDYASMNLIRANLFLAITGVANKFAPTPVEQNAMNQYATNLEKTINSCPNNVRPGNSTMNSRIAENLDLNYAGVGTLPAFGPGVVLPGGFPTPGPWAAAGAWGNTFGAAPLAVGANYLYVTPNSNAVAYKFIMEHGCQFTARPITIVRNDDPANPVPGYLVGAPLSSVALPPWPPLIPGTIPVLLFDPLGVGLPLRFG
jgi:hypothetical protein